MADLPKEVRDYEPPIALDGGPDGLEKMRGIATQLREHLLPGGVVLLEIGYDQGEEAVAILESIGLADVDIERDMAGKDRFVVGRYPS